MMAQLTFKTKFRTQKAEPEKRKIISLHISDTLDEIATRAAKKFKITKQDLIRQMMRHCLKDIGFDVPQDTDSPPPTKRVYDKGVRKKR